MSEQDDLTGGCQCGAVRYALHMQPKKVHFCHCRMCQKAVGGAFALLAPVKKDRLEWTRGEPGFFQSSTLAERGFCRSCGTPLSFAYLDSEWISVTIGSLDDPGRAKPEIHYGVESQVPWLVVNEDLPRERTEEAATPEQLAKLKSHQHPDHD